ncbi:hypothetical protein ARMGADRAFT_93406 [Armillaria gallica]|uniref:Uncharacterized protein n=1 Tax=Armillaria gallica TaxID=47427 RepID=A0A2H3CXQ3_ARMGA|nr:hypothetical protein ARMGADRAFT_93406 [Armillaria gallica]
MYTPRTVQVKITKEELDERFPLPKPAGVRLTSSTMNHSNYSMVVNERESKAHLANLSPVLAHVVLLNGSDWRRPSPALPAIHRYQSSQSLAILSPSTVKTRMMCSSNRISEKNLIHCYREPLEVDVQGV